MHHQANWHIKDPPHNTPTLLDTQLRLSIIVAVSLTIQPEEPSLTVTDALAPHTDPFTRLVRPPSRICKRPPLRAHECTIL